MSPIESLTQKTSRPALNTLIAPWLLVIIAVISVQIGAAVAKQLFATSGTSGVVFIRTALSALIFYVLWRPPLHGHTRRAYLYMFVYGVLIASMMLTFYAAIARIPLGIAVAVAFAGPLGVAVFGSRRPIDLLWVALAAAGIILLSPITNADLDPFGLLLALVSSLLWAGYILLTKRINRVLPGSVILTLSMIAAALVALPLGIGGALHVFNDIGLIALSLVIALLSSAIPFGLEFAALKSLTPRVFGLLVSLEPVVAAFIGFILLHETLDLRALIGIGFVTIAAIATTRSAA